MTSNTTMIKTEEGLFDCIECGRRSATMTCDCQLSESDAASDKSFLAERSSKNPFKLPRKRQRHIEIDESISSLVQSGTSILFREVSPSPEPLILSPALSPLLETTGLISNLSQQPENLEPIVVTFINGKQYQVFATRKTVEEMLADPPRLVRRGILNDDAAE